MHTFRESASVSENASWHPNRDYRYHPPHNPIHGLNRRIIPLRFALLPYLHKGGSLSQRPRSLSLSFSRVRIGVRVHASIENTPWGPSIPRPSLEWFRFRSPRAHHRGMTFKHWKAVDGRSFGESCKLFYGIRGSVSLSVRDTIETDTRGPLLPCSAANDNWGCLLACLVGNNRWYPSAFLLRAVTFRNAFLFFFGKREIFFSVKKELWNALLPIFQRNFFGENKVWLSLFVRIF